MIVIVLALVVGPCFGQQTNESHHVAMTLFNSFDTNKDGFITDVEMSQEMAKFDANGNGKVSRHEYTEFICRTAPEAYDYSHFVYDALDFNGDHTLDAPDYHMFFTKMDSDGDGMADFADFRTASRTAFQQYQTQLHHELHAHEHSSCH